MTQHGLKPDDIVEVVTHVHQGAIDVLGRVVNPETVHQAKFSMGTVLGMIARFGVAGVNEFETHFADPVVADFRVRVKMALDAEVDGAYPARWIGKVTVHTRDGRVLQGRVDEPKGDPGNTLSRAELEAKALALAQFGGAASEGEMREAFDKLWGICAVETVGMLLGGAPS